jgi:Rrf2 family protein
MKLINKDADYAIKALVEIAGRKGEVASAAGLTGPLGLPWPYLRKILQGLARAGLVSSSRGRGGGFVLARPAGSIRLADVIAVFQGPVRIHDCLFKERLCPDVRTCPLRTTLDRLEARLVAELEAVTVADLLSEKSRPGGAPARHKGGQP